MKAFYSMERINGRKALTTKKKSMNFMNLMCI